MRSTGPAGSELRLRASGRGETLLGKPLATREEKAALQWRSNNRIWLSEAVIRALVFDFDGLILDTQTAEHQAWQEIYLEHGSELPLDQWRACGTPNAPAFDPCDQLERQLGELVDREQLCRRHRHRATELLGGRSILPGVSEFIGRARERNMLLAVASCSPRSWVQGNLQRLALESNFDVIRCAEDVSRVKPDPELHLSVSRALGVEPEDSIAIEDSPIGIAAAKAAGFYCVSIPNSLTRSLSMDAADLVLVSLTAITLDEVVERAQRQGHQAC